ncbi:MAG: GMC family oxidoreductase [Myxococcales bacterium]|nr:GMC family oxidoreductase [Myxococcales bacterium]
MSGAGVVFDASRLSLPLRLSAEVCVVGSGAGGMTAAMVAAEAGREVLVLEAGELLSSSQMSQREEEMFPRLFWESGGRSTRDRAVKVHQGRGVGGSTLHNLNLCKRVPEAIRSRWQRERGLRHLPPERWESLYSEVESLLRVSPVPEESWSRHNQLLREGCRALGWKGGGLSHNRTGCIGSGFCEVGCAYDAKNNAARVLLPRALAAGAQVLSCCQAVRVQHQGGKVRGVQAVAVDPRSQRPVGEVHVEAKRVCLSASATGTAAMLLRSGVPDPGGETGDTLRIHPAVVAAGDFEEEVRAWEGIPQSYECTELLQLEEEGGHRSWILPAFAHPVGAATMVPGHGAAHREVMRRYPHLGVFTAMIHDLTAGRVRPEGELGLSIDYWPEEGDRRELAYGLWACAKLLFAAGARRVLVPTFPPRSYERGESVDELRQHPIEKGGIDVVAVHPMSSVPMGDDPKVAAVDSEGRHHHLEGLFVADGSLFPTSIGGPPQLSIYALGLQVGRALARS